MAPRRRPRVVRLTIKEIRDIYRVRANLLELIASDIARDVSLADIRTFQPIMQIMEVASKVGDVNARLEDCLHLRPLGLFHETEG